MECNQGAYPMKHAGHEWQQFAYQVQPECLSTAANLINRCNAIVIQASSLLTSRGQVGDRAQHDEYEARGAGYQSQRLGHPHRPRGSKTQSEEMYVRSYDAMSSLT